MKINLLLFLTYNSSLNSWKKANILDREISLYKKYLNESENKINIISFGDFQDSKLVQETNLNIYPIFKNKTKSKFLIFILSIIYIFKNSKNFKNIDIIKTNQVLGAHLAILLKIILKKKLIIRMGYEPYLQLKKYGKNKLKIIFLKLYCLISYKFSDHIVITTEELKKKIINTYNISSDKITVVPNFIDTTKFKKKKEFSNDNFFTITRFDDQKNLIFLFYEIINNKKKIYIYGDKENASSKHLELYKLNGQNIKIEGLIKNNDLPDCINNHKFFILLSHSEGNPKAMLEAMACERIIIGSSVDGIKNIIQDGINGFLFNLQKDNLGEILKKIERSDTNLITKNARKYVLENHDLNIIFNKEIDLIKKILVDGKEIAQQS